MEENRNNGMNGMNPNMGGMNPPVGARGIPAGMNQNMNGMGGMGGMNPAAGGAVRPPMGPNDKQPPAPVPPAAGAGVSTALVPVGKAAKEPEKKKKKKRPSVFYNIFAILMFLLMVGGLFTGLLGKYWVYLSPSSLYLPENVENTTLTGTLVGILIDGIMNIQGYLNFGEGVVGIMGALQHLLPAISLLVLAVCVVYGLIAMIIALFSRTNSRRALQIVATCMLVGYGCCGLSTLFFGSFAQVDFVSLALAALGFLICFITTIIANKQIGAMNAFISLFSIAATALFALPMSDMRVYALESDAMMPVIFGFVSLGVLYLNFFFTAARVCAKKGKIFDLIMHTLQFALIVTVFVMTLLATDPMTDMFRMIMPLVCSVGSPALALVTFALSIVIVFMPKILKKSEDKKATKSGAKANAKAKEKDKKKKDQPDEQRPMNPALPYGAPAPNMAPAQPMMNRPAPAQPQQPQRPMQQPQQTQQPMRPMPNQANRPPMRQNPPRKDDDFSGTAKSFKVPFSTGGGDKKTDPATQAALEKLAQEMRNMKEAQSHAVNATPQEDSKTRAAIESLAEQLRAMKEAQKQTANQGDAETKSAIEQLTEELRAMKEAQAKAEAERRAEEEAKKAEAAKAEAAKEAERKAAEEARIAEAERRAAEAKAEAERIAKEAEQKAAEARLEAEKKTEEERRRLEEERRRLEEERKAAEAARIEAERKAEEARAEAERRAAEAKAEADRRAAEEARAEAERRAAEAKAEAERKAEEERRKAEEERRKIEEEKRKLEEERKAVEAAKAEAEKKRQDELEQLKRELRELKTAQNQPVEPDSGDDNMAKIMEELRALKESQGTSSTTYNYLQDDSHGKELSEFEKRMEALIRSQQQKEPAPKREPTAFEKRMAELAARKAAMGSGGASASSGVAASPRASMPAQPAVSNEPSRYGSPSLDPFFSTLTNAEINEFGDIFIANKIGVLEYMPAYVAGGDNKDFFNKAVIYLGKFRGSISRGLLDKLLKYIRSAR